MEVTSNEEKMYAEGLFFETLFHVIPEGISAYVSVMIPEGIRIVFHLY